jgi:putative Ca2+/H+ antiporter (TMEM165/GDT1 family)
MVWSTFLTVFATVFVAEVGDKTQLAALLYAADDRHGRWTVFLAAAAALLLSTALAVLAGGWLSQHVDRRVLARVAGAGFVAVGVWTFVRA